MPEWGLTAAMRRMEPYGLPSWCLNPGKVVTDPIHGDIFITRLEQLLLDSPPMQRLRRVRQLGTTHLVYPGATHTRFAHSLGAVRVVQTLLDTSLNQGDGNHPVDDLFMEWEVLAKQDADSGRFEEDSIEFLLHEKLQEPLWRIAHRRKLAEATVLARLGALLHDIGHAPFGHTIEDDLRLLLSHDKGGPRFEKIWKEVLTSCNAQILASGEDVEPEQVTCPLSPGSDLYKDLRPLILSSEEENGEKIDPAERIRYPFVADMVGNTICADLLDYLQRDHVFTGLPVSLGKRYLSSFYVTPMSAGGIYKQRMALLIHRAGRERHDIVTEILKHLRYRYELQERVLVHHTKLAADAMVGKMFELWIGAKRTDIKALIDAGKPPDVPTEFRYKERGMSDELERAARWALESRLFQYGDDGVLEGVAGEHGSKQLDAAAELAQCLLDRDLYKPAANAVGPAGAEDLHGQFGSIDARRQLESDACEHAGITNNWHLVLWIPDPDMRLKLAELLVNDGRGIAKFKDQSSLGSDIYAAHKDLWTISVFVHPSVRIDRQLSALAFLGQKLGLSWDAHVEELGSDPTDAPAHLAAARALEKRDRDSKVNELIAKVKFGELASRGERPVKQDDLDKQATAIAKQLGWINSPPEPQL